MKTIIMILVAILLITGCQNNKEESVKIGVITDLTGYASYWGQSTLSGANLAVKELKEEGYNVELIVEDYQLDPKKAVSSYYKLKENDNVEGLYVDLNPAAIAISPLIDKDTLLVYDAAIESPLSYSGNIYKTYFDFREGCKLISEKFKEQGIKNMGMLKINLEAGELCLEGVREVYPDVHVESYNIGDSDLRTQILKLSNKKVEAVIHAAFEEGTMSALKIIKENNLDIKYGTNDDSITKEVINNYKDELEGSITFSLKDVPSEFKSKLPENLATDYAAALAYVHIKQMGKSISICNKNIECAKNEMNIVKEDNTIGFKGFENNKAVLELSIKQL